MKKLLIGFLSVLLLINLIGIGLAEEMGVDTKWRLYTAESKNPWLAVGSAWLLPTLGHAYAGNWGRGLPFLGAEVAGLALAMSSIQGSTINTSQYSLGFGVFLVARIWEYMDAYGTAEDFNRQLKKKYDLTFIIREGLPAFAFNYRF